MGKPKTDCEIQNAENELEAAQNRYLRSHGWRHTSSSPGCLWMWVKECEVEDKVGQKCLIMVDTKTAVSMQKMSCSIRGNKW